MGSFNDPYSRHIPGTIMTVRQRGIRGEAVGIGIVLRRRWHFEEFKRAISRLFLEPTNKFKAADINAESPPILPAVTTSIKRGNILTHLRDRFRKRTDIVPNVLSKRDCMMQYYPLFLHLKASLHTAAPFILATTCQHIRILKNNNSGLNIRTIRILGIVLGVLQIFRKISPVLCPIEVAFVQPEGPSELSGVEIGDQLFFINGKAVDNFSLKKVNGLLCDGEVGDVVNVGIVRSKCPSFIDKKVLDKIKSKSKSGESSAGAEEHNYSNIDSHSNDDSICPVVHWMNNFHQKVLDHTVRGSSDGDRGEKSHLSLGIIRDNVFSSKVSSCILSLPSNFSRVTPDHINSYISSESDTLDRTMLVEEIVGIARNMKSDRKIDSDREDLGHGSIGYLSIGEFTQRTLLEVESAIEDIKYQLFVISCNDSNGKRKNREGKRGKDEDSSNKISLSSNSHLVLNDISTNRNHIPHESQETNNLNIPNYLDALIIDLRGNLGGTLPSALDAASLFLPKGQVLLRMKSIASTNDFISGDLNKDTNINNQYYVRNNENQRENEKKKRNFSMRFLSPFRLFKRKRKDKCEKYYSIYKNADTSTPLLLLVDSQTASASEIFVAALVDNKRATCMGSRTLGKNVAQVR